MRIITMYEMFLGNILHYRNVMYVHEMSIDVMTAGKEIVDEMSVEISLLTRYFGIQQEIPVQVKVQE